MNKTKLLIFVDFCDFCIKKLFLEDEICQNE